MSNALKEWPLWEVFVRSKQGLEHKHCGSLHATDASQALQMARDVYTRRQEGVSIWVVRSADIIASSPDDKGELFDPAADKIYRHPTFYDIPDDVGHMYCQQLSTTHCIWPITHWCLVSVMQSGPGMARFWKKTSPCRTSRST